MERPLSHSIFYRLLSPGRGEDAAIFVAEKFEKLRTAGCPIIMAHFSCFAHLVSAILVDQGQQFFAYICGIQPSIVLFGRGNGSLMSPKEKFWFYLGQAAIGGMAGLGIFLVQINTDERFTGEVNPLLKHSEPLMVATPTEYYQLGFECVSIGAAIWFLRTAWERDELPILASIWGGGLGALEAFLFALMPTIIWSIIGQFIEPFLPILAPSETKFHVVVFVLMLVGVITNLREKYGSSERERAFYKKLATLSGGTWCGFLIALVGVAIPFVILIVRGYVNFVDEHHTLWTAYVLLSGTSLVAGAAIGFMCGLRELRKQSALTSTNIAI
jgi:hypothetical protein